LKIRFGSLVRLGGHLLRLIAASQKVIERVRLRNMSGGGVGRHVQTSGDARRQFLRHHREVCRRTVIGVRPQHRSIRDAFQPGNDFDAIALPIHVAFQQVCHLELPAGFANIDLLSAELRHRTGGDHAQCLQAG
jgi:hypothetical protein